MKYIITILTLFICQNIFAKKVKFSVDFGTDSVSILGAHIVGDFQIFTGLQSNWIYDSTLLIHEGTTGIHSIVLDIPAFKRYEYRFVNGAFGYEQENPPIESQVQDGFRDNRFVFIDSTANDTTILPAVRYNLNAPAGKYLIRPKVDMSLTTPSAQGVHIYSGFIAGPKAITRMCPLDNAKFHSLIYVDSVTNAYEYDFLNGNTQAFKELKDQSCALPANSRVVVASTNMDIETQLVCFAKCTLCPLDISTIANKNVVQLTPNPSANGTMLSTNLNNYSLAIYNTIGQVVYTKSALNGNTFIPAFTNNGVYQFVIKDANQQKTALLFNQQ